MEIGPYLGGSLNFRPRHDAFMPTPPGGNTSSNFSPPQWVTRVGTPPSTCMGKSTTVVPFPVESLAVVTNSSIAHHNNNSHNVPLNFLGSLSRSSLSSVPISKSATTSVWGSGNRTSPPASVVMPCTRTTRYASSSAARAHSCNQTRTVAPRVVAWRPDDFLSSNSVYRTTDTCCTPSSGMLSVASPFAGPSLRFNGFMNPHRDAGYRCEAASHRSFSPNVAYQNDLTMSYSAMTPSPLERSFVPPPSWDGMEPSMSSDTARTACCHGSGSPGSSFVVSRFMSRLGDMVQRTGSSSDCYSRPRKINRLNTTSRAGQSATHHFEVNSIRGDAQGSLESRACRNSTGFGVGERPKSQETTTTQVERQRSQFAGSNNSNTNDACSSGPPNRGVIPYPRFRASNTARLDNNVQKCLISLNSHDGTAGMTSSEPVSQVHNINTSHNSPMTGQSPNSQECMSTQTTAATSTLTATNNTAHNISDEVSTPNCDNNIIITSPKHKVHNKQSRTKSPGSTTNDHPLTSVEQDEIENELQLDVIESFMRSPLDSSQQLNSAKRSTTWPATSLAVLRDNNLQGNEGNPVVSSNNNNLRVRKPSGYADPKSEIDGDQSNIMSAVSPSFDSTALGDEHETSIDEASPSFTSKDPVLLPDGGTPQAKGETDSACQRRGRVFVKDLDNGLAKALLKNTLFTDSKASSPCSSAAGQQPPSAQADIRKMLTVNSNVANECLENTLHIRNYLSNLVPPAAIRFVISRELNVWPSKWPLIRNVSIMSQKKSSCTGNNNAGNVSRGLEETIKAVMELDCHKLMKQVATNNGRDMISSAMKHIVESMHSTPVSPGVKNRRMTSSPSGEVLPITELRKPLTTSRANENDQPKINKRKSAESARCNGTTNISGNWDDLTKPSVVRNCPSTTGKTFGRDQGPPREGLDESLPKGTQVKEGVTPHAPTSEAESVLLGQCNAKPTTSFGVNDEYSMAQTPSTKASNNDQHQSSLVLPLPTSSADHLGDQCSEDSYRQPVSEVTETVTSPSEVDSQFMASKSPKSSISKEEVFLPPSPQFFMPARNANYTGATIIRHVHGGFRLSLDMPPSMMIPKSDLMIGEPISKGTFGTVYKGMWKGREVAIKVSHIDTSSASVAMSLEHLKNFEREVNAYLKLKHEHVVTCYGISVEPPCFLAIVMEFVKSGNVFDLFFENKHYIGAAKRLSMAKQLVSAVCYLHGNKPTVVHRDLKTPNLILDQDLNLKLCDFGKTKFMNGPFLLLEDNGGSPRYMAPECFASNGLISEKADIWSLACCLIEIFGGPIPYEEYYDNARVIQRILTYGLPPLVPNWFMKPLQQILHAAFSFDPSLRPNALEIQAVVNSIKPRDMELRNMHRRRVN